MAATHCASLGKLAERMVEDARGSRVRGGGMLGVFPADISRHQSSGVRAAVVEPSGVTR
jgi:hypothetical protein